MDQTQSISRIPQLVILVTVLCSLTSCGPRPPSTTECLERWNLAGNRAAQMAIATAGFPRANVAGWTIKVGDYCSATFFTRPGSPWVNYVLWIDLHLSQELSSGGTSGAFGTDAESSARRLLRRRTP
jgi:hypothetical protein